MIFIVSMALNQAQILNLGTVFKNCRAEIGHDNAVTCKIGPMRWRGCEGWQAESAYWRLYKGVSEAEQEGLSGAILKRQPERSCDQTNANPLHQQQAIVDRTIYNKCVPKRIVSTMILVFVSQVLACPGRKQPHQHNYSGGDIEQGDLFFIHRLGLTWASVSSISCQISGFLLFYLFSPVDKVSGSFVILKRRIFSIFFLFFAFFPTTSMLGGGQSSSKRKREPFIYSLSSS